MNIRGLQSVHQVKLGPRRVWGPQLAGQSGTQAEYSSPIGNPLLGRWQPGVSGRGRDRGLLGPASHAGAAVTGKPGVWAGESGWLSAGRKPG